jgi:hypothetical protein
VAGLLLLDLRRLPLVVALLLYFLVFLVLDLVLELKTLHQRPTAEAS